MTVTFEWKGEEFKRAVVPVFTKGLQAAADEGADMAARTIKARAASGGEVGAGGGRVSKPGESPTTQVGVLRQSINASKVKALVSRIGTNLAYGLHLELGTSKMAHRPWLRPAVLSNRGRRRMQRRFVAVATREFSRIRL